MTCVLFDRITAARAADEVKNALFVSVSIFGFRTRSSMGFVSCFTGNVSCAIFHLRRRCVRNGISFFGSERPMEMPITPLLHK